MRFLRKPFIALFVCIAMLAGSMNATTAFSGSNYYSVSYTMIGTISQQIGYVDRASGGLDAISPLFFEIMDDGSLKLAYSFSLTLIEAMHNRGVKVVPYLSNHWDQELGRKAMANRVAFVSQLANVINTYNIDGIDFDIENLTQDDRADVTDFIRLLRIALPNKIIAVAVAANPNYSTTGWQGSYDYTALAGYADYLMMMTYEEHSQGGPEGANASYRFTEASIKYALSKAPANKIVLGIPFYGRYWKQDAEYSGYPITNEEAEYLISNYDSTVRWDSASSTPVATVTISDSDVKPIALYRTMPAGTYNIWYENEASIRSKLGLIRKYGLKGAGSWALGYEPANMWTYYKSELKTTGAVVPPTGYVPLPDNPFADINGNWSYDNILYAYQKGWMNGTGDNQFSPLTAMTRGQAAALFVRALGLENDTSNLPTNFTDIEDHWAKQYIQIAAKNKVMLGVGDNEFKPDEILTREQAAVLIERILPADPTYVRPPIEYFDQSDISDWAVEPLMRITKYKIMTGLPDYTFLPKNPLLRSEMAALIRRAMDYIAVHKN